MNGAIGLKANAWSTNNSYDIEITSIPLMEGTTEPFEGMTVTFKVSKVTLMAKRNQMVEWKLLGKTRMSCVMGYYDLCNNFGKIWTYGEMISLRKFHWEKLEL